MSSTRLGLAAVLLAAVTLGLLLARPAALVAADVSQPRLDQPAPVPRGAATIGQSFVAAHDGLSSVELLAAVHGAAAPDARLRLRLLDHAGVTVAEQAFAGLAHNAPLRLTFQPLPESAGKTYRLQLEGSPASPVTAWAYSLDGYPGGTLLVEGIPSAGDLRFATSYTYLWTDALRDGFLGLLRVAAFAPALWLILFAPGLLWLGIWPVAPKLFWVRVGLALGLSLSLLALAWLWVSVAGLSLSPTTLWVVYGLVAAALIWRGARSLSQRRPSSRATRPRLPAASVAHHLSVALILALGLSVRLLATRDVALPLWVDGSHHYLIARLLSEAGRVPASYAPLLPIDRFLYHFGFHALAASADYLMPLSLPEVFLLLGQILNALAPLAAYTFAAGLSGRPGAGLAAAYFTGLVSLFPGYYVTWGRYTQLTGLLILAPAMVALWNLVSPLSSPVATLPRAHSLLPHPPFTHSPVPVLAAGLLLTHYPLFLFFVLFVPAALLLRWRDRGAWLRVGAAALVGAALCLPWLARLYDLILLPVVAPARFAAPAGYNAFPFEYFRTALERGWIALALVGLAWGLLRRDRAHWLVAAWLVLLIAALNLGDGNWLVINHNLAITLFLPGALVLGWGADHWVDRARALMDPCAAPGGPQLIDGHPPAAGRRLASAWARLRPYHPVFGMFMLGLLASVVAYAGKLGLYAQAGIVNPVTVLASDADLPALEWIERNVPADAVFLINGWEWLNGTWAGSDAGAWIWPLTGRRTTLPPADYVNGTPEWQAEINAFNARVMAIPDPNGPEAIRLLRAAGVTHVFIGARGGPLRPEMFLAQNPASSYRLLYTNGAAWVFELVR